MRYDAFITATERWFPETELAKGSCMYVLIDTTNLRALARHENFKALTALHYIEFANVSGCIVRCGENRPLAQFDQEQLVSIALNLGALSRPVSYPDLVQFVAKLIADLPELALPFDGAHIIAQAYSIDVRDWRPMQYDPHNGFAKLLSQWNMAPQPLRARPRSESDFAIEFAAGTGYAPNYEIPLPELTKPAKPPAPPPRPPQPPRKK